MANCKCEKSPNGYYQWNCSRRSCKTFKDCKPAELKCQTSNEIVSVDQFEVVTKEYLKFNKKTKEVEKKSTKLTDHVSSQMTYKYLYKKLISVCKNCTAHKYHVYNDHHHWPIILSTIAKYGEITYSDYSENMSQLHKKEAQSCHFNKTSYSLHCAVEHVNFKNRSLKSAFRYLYHLSDNMKCDFAFTSTVAQSCLAQK